MDKKLIILEHKYTYVKYTIESHCNIVNNDYQQDSRILYTLFLINHLVNYQIFPPQILYF